MHKPGQAAAARSEFRTTRKPKQSGGGSTVSEPVQADELRRVRLVHGALTFPSTVLLALSALNYFPQPYNIVSMLVGCGLLLISIRTAGKLNQAEAIVWRDRHPRREDSAARVISSGILGDASGFWFRQYESSKMFMVALLLALLICVVAVVARTMMSPLDDSIRVLGYACMAIGVAQMFVGIWTVFAMFMHRSAFLSDFQALFEDASDDEAKDAYRGLIASA